MSEEKQVERFTAILCDAEGDVYAEMDPHPEGGWVRFEDYERLETNAALIVDSYNQAFADVARLRAGVKLYENLNAANGQKIARLQQENAALKAEIDLVNRLPPFTRIRELEANNAALRQAQMTEERAREIAADFDNDYSLRYEGNTVFIEGYTTAEQLEAIALLMRKEQTK